MCGIAGFFSSRPAADPLSILAPMVAALSRRGPDGRGLYTCDPGGARLIREVADGDGGRAPVPPPPVALAAGSVDVQVGLGVRRLAITDVAGGHAPQVSERGDVVVVLNGELYNYAPLREELIADGHRFASQGDTEVIAHLYEALGIEGVLTRIRGQFAIALWDARRGHLFLARDPLGIKPLHVALGRVAGGERLWFGSEARAILADPSFRRALNPAALERYLMTEGVPAPHTVFEGMEKLLPGHYLQIRAGGASGIDVRRRVFWRLPDRAADRLPDLPGLTDTAGWKALIRGALTEAVRTRIPREVPVASLLSGGIDSGLVTALLSQQVSGRLSAFSVAFTDPDFNEADQAARIASHLGLSHTVVPLGAEDLPALVDAIGHHQDEPLGDHSLVPTWVVSQAIRAGGFPVALSGDGGDELFAGYPTYLARRLDPLLDALPAPLARAGLSLLDRLPAPGGNFSADIKARLLLEGSLEPRRQRRQARWMGALPEASALALLDDDARARLAASPGADPHAEVDQWAWLHRRRSSLLQAQVQDLRFYMQDVILVKVDRASMAHSVEVRVPILDLAVVEAALALPLTLKIRGLTPKWILRELMKEVLPADIASAPKRGFGMPTARWLRQLGREQLMAWLEPPAGGPALLRPQQVQRYVDEHLAGRRDHRRILWTLIALRRWQSGPWAAGWG